MSESRPKIARVNTCWPGSTGRFLEVGHEARRRRVERVDDHRRLDRAGQLDLAVEQGVGDLRHPPVTHADRPRIGAETGQRAGIELRLPRPPRRKQGLVPGLNASVQSGQKCRGSPLRSYREPSSGVVRAGSAETWSRTTDMRGSRKAEAPPSACVLYLTI